MHLIHSCLSCMQLPPAPIPLRQAIRYNDAQRVSRLLTGAHGRAGVVVFVYLGSVAGGISKVLSGRVHPPAGVAVAGVIASTIAIFVTGALITAHARRAIQRCARRAA